MLLYGVITISFITFIIILTNSEGLKSPLLLTYT